MKNNLSTGTMRHQVGWVQPRELSPLLVSPPWSPGFPLIKYFLAACVSLFSVIAVNVLLILYVSVQTKVLM